jgi:hypothetical protein
VDVVASDEAREYVRDRGGTLFVRSTHHGCCGGGLTLLGSTTERPGDASDFLCVGSGDIDVRFRGAATEGPRELVIEMRGRLRRRPAAYWDGCAFRL